MERVTVLLTGCGAPGAPSIIGCLRKNGERDIHLVGVDANRNAPCRAMVDSFHVVPRANEDGFIDEIIKVCEAEGVQVVIPIVTQELWQFAASKDEFRRRNIGVSVMDYDLLQVANDKARLIEAIEASGLQTADFEVVQKPEDVLPACQRLGYPDKPVVVKMTTGNGSRGVRILDPNQSPRSLFFESKPNSQYVSFDDLERIMTDGQEIPELLVMEYLPGDEWGVDVLADNGRILAGASRRGLKVVSSNFMECVMEHNEQAYKLCEEVVERLGLDGSLGFDLKERADGTALIMEINPRLTGSIALNAVAGLNLPYLRVKHLLGEEIPPQDIKMGVVMQRMHKEVYFGPDGLPMDW